MLSLEFIPQTPKQQPSITSLGIPKSEGSSSQLGHAIESKITAQFGRNLTKNQILELSLADLEKLNQVLAEFDPKQLLDWSLRVDPDNTYLMTSAQPNSGFALSAIAEASHAAEVNVPVIFINTGKHFPEVLTYMEEISTNLDVEVVEIKSKLVEELEQLIAFPSHFYQFWVNADDTEEDAQMKKVFSSMCCGLRKVLPLAEWTLDQKESPIMLSSLRGRAGNGVLKVKDGQLRIHPWIHASAEYVEEDRQRLETVFQMPKHGLAETHASVGCQFCTKEGKNRAECRGDAKYECGLHLEGPALLDAVKKYQKQFVSYLEQNLEESRSAQFAELSAEVNQIFDKYLAQLEAKIEAKAKPAPDLMSVGFVIP